MLAYLEGVNNMAMYQNTGTVLSPDNTPSADTLLNSITATNASYYGESQQKQQTESAYNPFKIDSKSQEDAQAQQQANIAQWLSPVDSIIPEEKYTDKHHEHFVKEIMNDKAMKELAPHIDEAEEYIQVMRSQGASQEDIGNFVKKFGMEVVRSTLDKHHHKDSDTHQVGIFDNYGIPNNIKNKAVN